MIIYIVGNQTAHKWSYLCIHTCFTCCQVIQGPDHVVGYIVYLSSATILRSSAALKTLMLIRPSQMWKWSIQQHICTNTTHKPLLNVQKRIWGQLNSYTRYMSWVFVYQLTITRPR